MKDVGKGQICIPREKKTQHYGLVCHILFRSALLSIHLSPAQNFSAWLFISGARKQFSNLVDPFFGIKENMEILWHRCALK